MTDMRVISRNAQTDGYLRHTGQLTVSCKLDSGAVVTLTLPDDWQTLLARVSALEARVIPNSLEDLTYAG